MWPDLPEPLEAEAYQDFARRLKALREQVPLAKCVDEVGLPELYQVLQQKRGSRR